MNSRDEICPPLTARTRQLFYVIHRPLGKLAANQPNLCPRAPNAADLERAPKQSKFSASDATSQLRNKPTRLMVSKASMFTPATARRPRGALIYLALLSYISLGARAISIKPADFDRLVMPCYLGASASSAGSFNQQPQVGQSMQSAIGQQVTYLGSNQPNRLAGSSYQSGADSNRLNQPTSAGSASNQLRDNLGQQVPRASTLDNFVALVAKIESANPRLANNPDQLIRTLLSRFRMDNYYYDVRSRTPISEQDHRTLDIIPALFGAINNGYNSPGFMMSSDIFPEQLLSQDEKCSMYFMLSHYVEKSTPMNPPLASLANAQLAGPERGQRPPSLQAAGSGYPAQSANQAYSANSNTGRYPGPASGFGSPATNNMNSFGSGLSNSPDYTQGRNPYGMNVPQPANLNTVNAMSNLRNQGQYLNAPIGGKYSAPYVDGNARNRDERLALELGVVTLSGQDNAALVLNRVLMGLLAANTAPQSIRQLSSFVYPTQPISNTPKIDEEIDPLYAVTLADLWAVSSIPKPGKPFDLKMLGDNGRWTDTMCPVSFQLERPNSIRFTTAELIGGLDGFSLGLLRRKLLSMRKNLRLSDLLKMYYSKTGFRPQFAEVSVCNRASAVSSQLDELKRQAENYLRLYQLNLPISDTEISNSINRLDAFKELVRQAANQYAPQELCQETSGYGDAYPTGSQDQCEIARADLVVVLDTSPQANELFMAKVVTKLAQKIGLSNQGSSLTVLTNQQDTTGYAGTYSFNAIVRNSTNTAEIGCSLVHDQTKTYQGGQINEPTRLIEMFERALVNLDSEYLVRQVSNGQSSSSWSSSPRTSYVSSLFGQTESMYYASNNGPRNTGGAKTIVWFNYGQLAKPSATASSPTNWNGPSSNEQGMYRFMEAKKYLKENFRGASILAVASNRDDVKSFVYDEQRDIFSDIPPGDSGTSLLGAGEAPAVDQAASMLLDPPAEQLANRLLQRMCDVPATFQYPLCFRTPSDGIPSIGYISPGRRQYWMMAPKTFFASHSIRMAFRVEGGRLRICFGRMQKPDETALKNPSQQSYQSGGIAFGSASSSQQNQAGSSGSSSSSSSDYYTGMEYGICKDVSPGQEIEFIVNDPCYKRSIADCEPFYFVISEISNPGEGDPNYMCKDEGCKRFDQVKFTMTHTGVLCSSAFERLKGSWLVLVVSVTISLGLISRMPNQYSVGNSHPPRSLAVKNKLLLLSTILAAAGYLIVQQVQAQQANPQDFGQGRYGEKRGNFTPSEVLAIILLIMTIFAGLALTVGLCYYVSKQSSRGARRVPTDGY